MSGRSFGVCPNYSSLLCCLADSPQAASGSWKIRKGMPAELVLHAYIPAGTEKKLHQVKNSLRKRHQNYPKLAK